MKPNSFLPIQICSVRNTRKTRKDKGGKGHIRESSNPYGKAPVEGKGWDIQRISKKVLRKKSKMVKQHIRNKGLMWD